MSDQPAAASGSLPEDDAPETGVAPQSAAPGRVSRGEPVLPDRAGEDRPEAWGERADEDDDEHYLRERPPHW